MVNKPWSDAFEWVADEFRIPIITSAKLDDVFTYVGPADAKCTLAEITVIINQTLVPKYGRILIRHERRFLLTVVDEYANEPDFTQMQPWQSALVRYQIEATQFRISRSNSTTTLFPARLRYYDSFG